MTQENHHQGSHSSVRNRGLSPELFLPVSIILSAILISGSIIYAGSRGVSAPAPSPSEGGVAADAAVGDVAPKLAKDDVILGDSKAPVTIFLYEDYQCPFCHKFFNETESKIREEYVKTGKVKLVFRNFQFLGPESTAAGQAAECAKDQNKYWAYHDELMKQETIDGKENNGNINRDMLISVARTVGLDETSFASCFDSKKYAAQVEQDKADAGKYGVNSTPTAFVGAQKIVGAQPYETVKQIIEAALAKK